MLHKRIYIVSGNELEALIEDADKPASVNSSSCKEKVMEVVAPMLAPISQAVFKLESKLKELESSKVSEDYFEEMLAVINKALSNQQEEIDELIACQQAEDEEKPVGGPVGPIACVLPTQMAFLLKFNTQKDFENAEPCLRSLSDLLERNKVNFELIEL